jgi:UDP-N-acetylglucosamine 2-epimerase
MKILTVVGARPQFIKAAVVSRELSTRDNIREVLVHTGQHYDAEMSDVFFDELSIPRPNFNLGIGGGSHGAMTGAQLSGIESVILDEKPDWVLGKRQANRIFFYPPAGVIMWPIKLPQEDGHVTAKTTERKMRRAP